ncbi:MAG: ligase-associated DNA damage response exonuclease [Alphaproteobacteria bacterium]|nr:ligase-associated DNA damage response exonuclease [Alphaproteobacteria bacterium]MBV9693909.1 ligase-associated DNA damage response exonuclease [Alphaproteobacteria bacterium]
MVKPHEVLCRSPAGLYCPPGDFYIDPVRPVKRAVITHGHSDHARMGHESVLATAETLAIMAARMGEGFSGATQALRYGEVVARDGVEVSLHPAGHILGSAQVKVRARGLCVAVSGDYKRRRDPTCAAFEPQRCDVFVTEATFGIPVFNFPDDGGEAARLLKSVAQFPERSHLVGAYALGKAQRLILLLREAGYHETIFVHGAVEAMNALYGRFGIDLGPLAPATVDKAKRGDFAGAIVVAPPSAIDDRWSRRFADPLPAFASGWMRVRARARQRQVELPLVISDHADWNELTATIREVEADEIWITHGNEEALLRWCALGGQKARALSLVGYDADEGEG